MPTPLPMQQFTPPPQPGQTVTAQQLSGLGSNQAQQNLAGLTPMPPAGQNAPPGAPAMPGQPSWAGALMQLLGQLNLPPEIMNHLGGIFGMPSRPQGPQAPAQQNLSGMQQQQAGPGPMPGDPGYGGQSQLNTLMAGKGTTGLVNPNAGAVGGNMPAQQNGTTFTTMAPEPVQHLTPPGGLAQQQANQNMAGAQLGQQQANQNTQTIPQPGKGTMPPPNPNAGAVGGNMPAQQVNNPALGNRGMQAPQPPQQATLQPWQRPQQGAPPSPFQTPAPAPANVQSPMGRQPWQRMQSPLGRVETQPWATNLTGASGSGNPPTPGSFTPQAPAASMSQPSPTPATD